MSVRIVVLGGYGNAGRAIVRLLLEHTNAQVVVAGRRLDRARALADAMSEAFGAQRVSAVLADADRPQTLADAFSGARLVVVASSTADRAATVAEAVLAARADYLDVQLSPRKHEALRALAPRITAAGRCFVTDGGFHPGLPAALVRYAATRIEHLQQARVASVIQLDWSALDFARSTVDEMVDEFSDFDGRRFVDGEWRGLGFVESVSPMWVTFGHGWGRRYVVPMYLEELRALPDLIPTLHDTGFYVGGFNPVVDLAILPLAMGWSAVAGAHRRSPLGPLLVWGLKRFSRPPYGTLLQLDAEGVRDGRPHRMVVEIAHADAYWMTAAPAVACVLQMLDGRAPAGVHFQAHLVDPARLLADLEHMGADVTVDGAALRPRVAPVPVGRSSAA